MRETLKKAHHSLRFHWLTHVTSWGLQIPRGPNRQTHFRRNFNCYNSHAVLPHSLTASWEFLSSRLVHKRVLPTGIILFSSQSLFIFTSRY